MKVTRDMELEILFSMAKRVGMVESDHNRRELLYEILEAVGITIEPPPILPGVTQGEWKCDPDLRGIVLAGGKRIAVCFGEDGATQAANSKVMAGSKELAKAEIERMRVVNYKCNDILNSEYRKAIEKALIGMGVDMTEFEGE